MRLASFEHRDGRRALGVGLDDRLVDLSLAAPELPNDMAALLADRAHLERARVAAMQPPAPTVFARSQVTLLPPVPNPGKIVCVGINYQDHAAETGRDRPDYPVLFARYTTTLVAHDQPIVRPGVSEMLDYEGELVAVIGRGGRHLSRDRALGAVAAYGIFNDASVRDYQRKTPQFTPGKNFDATGGFGPDLMTADELPAGASGLRITTRLNGRIVQDDTTDSLLFDVADLVTIVSEIMTLEPGDLIVTGTPGGVGAARTPPLWMRPGDVCEVEIEGIGVLRNPIVAETAPEPGPAAS